MQAVVDEAAQTQPHPGEYARSITKSVLSLDHQVDCIYIMCKDGSDYNVHAGAFERRMNAAVELVQHVQAVGSQHIAHLLDSAPACRLDKASRTSSIMGAPDRGASADKPRAAVGAVLPNLQQHGTPSDAAGPQQDRTRGREAAQKEAAAIDASAGDSEKLLNKLDLVLSMLENQDRTLQQNLTRFAAKLQHSAAAVDTAKFAARSWRDAGILRHARQSSRSSPAVLEDLLQRVAPRLRRNPEHVGAQSRAAAHTVQRLPRHQLQPEWDDSLAGQAPRHLQSPAAKLQRARPMQRHERPASLQSLRRDSCRSSTVLRHGRGTRCRQQLGAHEQRSQRMPAVSLCNSRHDSVCPSCAAALAADRLGAGQWCICDGRH